LLQGLEIRLLPLLPLLEGPFLDAPLQQGSPVKSHGGRQGVGIAPPEGGLKRQHVHGRAGQVQREGAGSGRAQPAGFRTEGAAESGQAIAQAVQRGGLAAVGPEQPGQPVPLHLAALAQGEQGQDRLALAEAEARNRPAGEAHLDRSEQPDAQCRCRIVWSHRRPSLAPPDRTWRVIRALRTLFLVSVTLLKSDRIWVKGSGGAPMSERKPAPPAPGPLEEYATLFDPLFTDVAQRRGFREYVQGLLLPRDRNKTLTAVAGAAPTPHAQAAPVQALQFF